MLKLIALITMVIDHVGFLFFPDQEWMRAIGRLTMPIFGYAVARGYFYTSDKSRYLLRMGILAVASQIPYTLLAGTARTYSFGEIEFWIPTLNMVVPWALAVALLRLNPIAIGLIVTALFVIPMDYSSLVIMLPVAIYHLWFRDRKPVYALLSSSGVLIALALIYGGTQWWALLAIPLIWAIEPYDGKIRLNGWLFYFFYPVHMLLLVAIAYLVGSPSLNHWPFS